MNDKPLISVIIPCYNHGKYIEEALQSVEDSTNKYPVETIIINDGSTDPFTIEKLKELENQGYFVLNQENQGLGKTRNNGIKLAKGKYILPLDSDNKVCKPYLNDAIDLLENNENIDVVYGDARFFGEKEGVWKNKKLDIHQMIIGNHIDNCAIYRKDIWDMVDGYAEDMPYMGCEDWSFWLKCIEKNLHFRYLNKICFEYRWLSNSMFRTIPEDFYSKTFGYIAADLPNLYQNIIIGDKNKFHNILSGNLIKKVIKLILNHFNLYKY